METINSEQRQKLSDLYDKASQFNALGKVYSVIPDSMGYPTKTVGDAMTNSVTFKPMVNVWGLASAVPFDQLTVLG
jgi:hypothetical protein